MNGKAGRVREGRGCCAHSHQGRGLLSAGARTRKKNRGLLSGSCSSSTSIRSSGSVPAVVGVDLLQLPNGQPSKLHGHPGGVGMLLAALCLRRLRIWFWGGIPRLGGWRGLPLRRVTMGGILATVFGGAGRIGGFRPCLGWSPRVHRLMVHPARLRKGAPGPPRTLPRSGEGDDATTEANTTGSVAISASPMRHADRSGSRCPGGVG
jgi:hypothetical protein